MVDTSASKCIGCWRFINHSTHEDSVNQWHMCIHPFKYENHRKGFMHTPFTIHKQVSLLPSTSPQHSSMFYTHLSIPLWNSTLCRPWGAKWLPDNCSARPLLPYIHRKTPFIPIEAPSIIGTYNKWPLNRNKNGFLCTLWRKKGWPMWTVGSSDCVSPCGVHSVSLAEAWTGEYETLGGGRWVLKGYLDHRTL